MAGLRIRSIHHAALQSRKLAKLSGDAERCWWRLQCACDDDGRVEDDPEVLASLLFQVMRHVTPEQVDGWLAEMDDLGLIVRYEADGVRALAVVEWHDKQKPRRPQSSALPAPSDGVRIRPDVSRQEPTEPDPDTSGQVATATDKVPRRGVEGRGVGEEGGCGGESSADTEPALLAPPQPPAERGEQDASHNGQHQNCRACSTNLRANVAPAAKPFEPRCNVPDAALVLAELRSHAEDASAMPDHLTSRGRAALRGGA